MKAPSTKYRINVAIGSPEYPQQEAADPSAFAQKIRRQLTDDGRSLRVYGSEVVIARLTGDDGARARLHLLNYGGRDIEGLRVKLKGGWSAGDALVAGAGRVPVADATVSPGPTITTEFTLPRLGAYAVIDLVKPR